MAGLPGFWTRTGPARVLRLALLPGELRENLTPGQRVVIDLVHYAWCLTASVAQRERVTAADLLELEEKRAALAVRFLLRAYRGRR